MKAMKATLEDVVKSLEGSKLELKDGVSVRRPENVPWVQVKEKVKAKLPEKVNIWFCSEVNDKRECVVSCAPFEGDLKFFEDLQLDFDGKIVKADVAHGE